MCLCRDCVGMCTELHRDVRPAERSLSVDERCIQFRPELTDGTQQTPGAVVCLQRSVVS